mmetsp:Transcript_15123/g.45574  ORF Transcript_15123/g.45574 Transcript_15123/m.45574 type:complete len:364 (-) Transcript_15123:26-1117(-)
MPQSRRLCDGHASQARRFRSADTPHATSEDPAVFRPAPDLRLRLREDQRFAARGIAGAPHDRERVLPDQISPVRPCLAATGRAVQGAESIHRRAGPQRSSRTARRSRNGFTVRSKTCTGCPLGLQRRRTAGATPAPPSQLVGAVSRGGVRRKRARHAGWQRTSGRQHGLHAPPRRHVRAGGLHGGVGTRSGCSSKSRWQRDAPSSTAVGSAAERGVWRRVARRQVRATQQWRRVARWRRAGDRARPARREGEGEGRHRREAHAVALRHEGGRVVGPHEHAGGILLVLARRHHYSPLQRRRVHPPSRACARAVLRRRRADAGIAAAAAAMWREEVAGDGRPGGRASHPKTGGKEEHALHGGAVD